MELKCCFADCTSVRVNTFNRTAYGIEMGVPVVEPRMNVAHF